MKPILNCQMQSGATLLAGQSKRLVAPLSLQISGRQVAIAAPWISLRAPKTVAGGLAPKPLRRAEIAPLTAGTAMKTSSAASVPDSQRLPTPLRDRREDWFYALLTVLCLVAVAGQASILFAESAGWRGFLEFVRQLLA